MKLDIYLQKKYNYSLSYIRQLIKKNFIYINNFIINTRNYLVKSIDRIKIIKPKIHIPIIWENNHWILVYKPPGLTVERSNTTFKEDLVLNEFFSLYKDGLVNRIDKDTQGYILLAKTAYGYHNLRCLFFLNHMFKIYVLGVKASIISQLNQRYKDVSYLLKNTEIIKNYHYNLFEEEEKSFYLTFLSFWKKTILYSTIYNNYIDTSKIELVELLLKENNILKHSITKIEKINDYIYVAYPVTGRTHQIRKVFKYYNQPITGDKLYGENTNNYLQLYSIGIGIPFFLFYNQLLN